MMGMARRLIVLIAASMMILRAVMAGTPETDLQTLRVPEGFSIERVAGAPLVQHPIMAGFDDRGRLFVADNAGLNLPAEELLKQLPNMIRMLEDTDGDGRFDKSTVFADKMTFPQGAAWYRGALYVASPPSIWRLEDTDGDGVADKRDAIVGKFGFVGNAADIHGCFITPSGRIAWCDGRHGHEFPASEKHPPSKGLAARVFTCRPDGSDVETFCGGGMDNPVEVTFTPAGDVIGTMTFYNPDAARHDALVHFVYGGVYPKKHPCTSEFKRTGELMPALSRMGVVAPSGLDRYAGAAWGEEYRDNIFSTQFNTHKVVRHVLKPADATYTAADEDFLIGGDDFHPTDVLADADGSLLVIDTGGWFRIGCPTSQIAKPEIGGAIYRIRRTSGPRVDDPRGEKIPWAKTSDTEMAELLGDPRPAVAERAIEILAQRGDAAMGSLATALFESTDIRTRQNGVWALARNGSENARRLLRQALNDDDAPVRHAAACAASDLRDPESLPILIDLLAQADVAVQRAAATGIGRLKQASAVPALLKALIPSNDRFLDHAIIFALIEINDRTATLAGLNHQVPRVRRGTLIALDQMDAGQLTRELVEPLLAVDDAALQREVIEVLAKHPDWADALSGTLQGWLQNPKPTEEQLASAGGALAALGSRPAVQQLVTQALSADTTPKATRLMLLTMLAAGDWSGEAKVWNEPLTRSLRNRDDDVLRQTIATITALGSKGFAEPMLKLGNDTARSKDVRAAALAAASKETVPISDAGLEFLSATLRDKKASLTQRLAAAEALGGFKLATEQLRVATRLAEHCSPLELPWLLQAFQTGKDAQSGLALVAALEKAPALSTVSPESLKSLFESYPSEVQQAAQKLKARSAPTDAQNAEQLKDAVASLLAGDVAKGEDVFFGQRAACGACHRVAGRGEKIGPDLSKIGEVRNRRDLVEAVMFPNASLARGYESVTIATNDGRIHSGLIGRETAETIYLRTTNREEVRIVRADVEQLTPSRVSIMPQGLEKTLTASELSDLIAFLQSLK